MSITSIDKIKDFSQGELIQLSPFIENEPFVVRLVRPSLLQLAASGSIPNPLLSVAQELFSNTKTDSKVSIKEIADLLILIAKYALVEPTYQQLIDLNINLTDLQLIQIFNYTQSGVKALENFRKVQTNSQDYEFK